MSYKYTGTRIVRPRIEVILYEYELGKNVYWTHRPKPDMKLTGNKKVSTKEMGKSEYITYLENKIKELEAK